MDVLDGLTIIGFQQGKRPSKLLGRTWTDLDGFGQKNRTTHNKAGRPPFPLTYQTKHLFVRQYYNTKKPMSGALTRVLKFMD